MRDRSEEVSPFSDASRPTGVRRHRTAPLPKLDRFARVGRAARQRDDGSVVVSYPPLRLPRQTILPSTWTIWRHGPNISGASGTLS